MKNKQPTPRDIARKTLENKVFQGILSGGQILNEQALYGQLAVNGAKDTYNNSITRPEAQEIRERLQKEKSKEADNLGTYARPSISDYDVEKDVIIQIEENKSKLPLKDLEKIVKNIAGNSGYDFELPKELSNYVPLELQRKMQEAAIKAAEKGKKISPEDMNAVLNEEEKYALKAYNFLSETYNRGVALSTTNYFADLNELGKEIMEKYKPKESEE